MFEVRKLSGAEERLLESLDEAAREADALGDNGPCADDVSRTPESPCQDESGRARRGISDAQRKLIKDAKAKLAAREQAAREAGYERWKEKKRKADREEYAAEMAKIGHSVRPYTKRIHATSDEPELPEDRKRRHHREATRQRRGTTAASTRGYTDLSELTPEEKAHYKTMEARKRKRRQREREKWERDSGVRLSDAEIDALMSDFDFGPETNADEAAAAEAEYEALRLEEARDRIEAMRSELRDRQR